MLKMLTAALALGIAGTAGAYAQDTTTIIRRDAPTTVIERRESAPVERRTVETTRSVGCDSKTVTKTNDEGDSKTVHKESC